MNAILNFTSVYWKQSLSAALPDAQEFDFTALSGVRGYCDEASAQYLREQLSALTVDGIHLIDSGNYHYVSLFFLEKIKQPFSLVVFDHHTDMQPSLFGDLLSCGSWIWTALHTLPFLKEILLIGVGEESLQGTKEITFCDSGFSGFSETECLLQCHYASGGQDTKLRIAKKGSSYSLEQLFQELHYPVFLSIDKDVLSVDELETDWDQGSMSLRELTDACSGLLSSKQILGCDICGEPDGDGQIAKSNHINRLLISVLA
jgi:arginase family enzyme